MGLKTDELWLEFGQKQNIVLSPKHLDWIRGPPRPLLNSQ